MIMTRDVVAEVTEVLIGSGLVDRHNGGGTLAPT
jgi:hypothetical protein